jgi:hypothetical protein
MTISNERKRAIAMQVVKCQHCHGNLVGVFAVQVSNTAGQRGWRNALKDYNEIDIDKKTTGIVR